MGWVASAGFGLGDLAGLDAWESAQPGQDLAALAERIDALQLRADTLERT